MTCHCGRHCDPATYAEPIGAQSACSSVSAAQAVQTLLNRLVTADRLEFDRNSRLEAWSRSARVLVSAGYLTATDDPRVFHRKRVPRPLCRRCFLRETRSLYASIDTQWYEREYAIESASRRREARRQSVLDAYGQLRSFIVARDREGVLLASERCFNEDLGGVQPCSDWRYGRFASSHDMLGVLALVRPDVGRDAADQLLVPGLPVGGRLLRLTDVPDDHIRPEGYARIAWAWFVAGIDRAPTFTRLYGTDPRWLPWVRESNEILWPLMTGYAQRDAELVASAMQLVVRWLPPRRRSVLAYAIGDGARKRGIPVLVKRYDFA